MSLISCYTHANCGKDPASALKLYFELRADKNFETIANCASDEALEEYLKLTESLIERSPLLLKARDFIGIPYKKYKDGVYGAKGFYIENLTLRSKDKDYEPTPKISIIGVYQEGEYSHILYRRVEHKYPVKRVLPQVFSVINNNGVWKFAHL